ncbi:MAG TPA: ferritin-like domain-containing protein [Streptosporangiaceae bacterium]
MSGSPGPAGGGGHGGGLRPQARRDLAALQAALAVEQATSYAYGIIGAHLSGAAFSAAAADCLAHERARDSLTGLITARGGTPVPAAAAYRLPNAVHKPADAVALAIALERQTASAYLSLVAAGDRPLRAFGAGQMQAAAVREARWSGRSQAFPGLPGPAGRG